MGQIQQQTADLARRQLDLQERELEVRRQAQEAELELRRETQSGEIELRRLALELADSNEKAANARLSRADQARMEFARRGRTFAMWLAGGVTVLLIPSGIVCILLAIAHVIAVSAGLAGGGILLAGGLFAGIANLIGRFLPPGDGPSSPPSG